MSVETIQEQLIRELTDVQEMQSRIIEELRGQVTTLREIIDVKEELLKLNDKQLGKL